MVENKPETQQHHFSDYLKDHWDEVKDLEFQELK